MDIEAYLHFPYLTETELYESQLPQIARKSPVREATVCDWGHSKKLYKQTSLEPTSFGSPNSFCCTNLYPGFLRQSRSWCSAMLVSMCFNPTELLLVFLQTVSTPKRLGMGLVGFFFSLPKMDWDAFSLFIGKAMVIFTRVASGKYLSLQGFGV